MELFISADGTARCLYGEAFDLHRLGELAITRASHVEPDVAGRWWADLTAVEGPILGPFNHRSGALVAEAHWLTTHQLQPVGAVPDACAVDVLGPGGCMDGRLPPGPLL